MAEDLEQSIALPHPPGGADVLALGFGTTVAMWAVGYVGRMPAVMAPSWAVAGLMLACLLAGGYLAGRLTGRGWRGGLWVGLITAALNLLILGSLLGGDREPEAPPAFAWLPGTVLGMAIVTAAAAVIGGVGFKPQASGLKPLPNWTFRFSLVAVAGTALLLLAGGLVTGREAGLAVPDWPRSYGYNMFLYPLARMTGNIYYEHTHRLVGALVGLTTIALAAHLWWSDQRRWLRWVAAAAVIAVIAQGVMGGLRVAMADGSAAQVARAENETTASTVLRVAHGVSGQLFFALMVGIAVVTSTAWRRIGVEQVEGTGRLKSPGLGAEPGVECGLTVLLFLLLLVQLMLGALVRHLDVGVMLHITVASLVFLAAVATGMRVLAAYGAAQPALRRLAVALLAVVMLQVVLGIMALVFRGGSAGAAEPTVADVTATTAHQLAGAGLLGIATALMLLTHRLSIAKPRAAGEAIIRFNENEALRP